MTDTSTDANVTANRFDIREYRDGDRDGIVESFNRVFREVCGEGYVDRDTKTWDWEFLDNPAGNRITLAKANEDGVVAAHYAGVPQRVHTIYGECTFVHIVDSFVVPEYRAGLKRPGLFVTTAYPWFDLCDRMGDAVLYGYPVKAAERVGSRYLDYKLLRVIDYLCRDASEGDAEGPSNVEVERVDRIPVEADELFDAFVDGRECLLVRDRGYLDWRYLRCPQTEYEVWTARRDGDLTGICVLHPEHELVPSACTIADWIVPERDDATRDALLAAATRRAREGGRSTVMALFADPSPETKALLAAGFKKVPSGETMERRLTHRIYHPEMTSEWLFDNWWYTVGDTDLV